MQRIFIIILIIFISAGSLYPEKIRIAIIDFKADGVSKTYSRRISELVRNEIINTGSFTLIERSSMGPVFKEQAFQQAGCTDESCASVIGKLLQASKMLIGTIIKIGNKTIITGRIVDVAKGSADFSHSQIIKSEDRLFDGISLFAKNLSLRMHGKKPVKDTRPSSTTTVKDPPVKPDTDIRTIDGEGKAAASVNGKYYKLLQVVNCPQDSKAYGKFREWGYWTGSRWCGQVVQKGYWVWVAPNWYIWNGLK